MIRTAVAVAVVFTYTEGLFALPLVRVFGQPPAPQSQANVQKFGGRIVSQNEVRFVLKDYDNDIWYHIDDQEKARTFFGKDVLITGTFDGLTGTIRVQNIVTASPEQIVAANTERIREASEAAVRNAAPSPSPAPTRPASVAPPPKSTGTAQVTPPHEPAPRVTTPTPVPAPPERTESAPTYHAKDRAPVPSGSVRRDAAMNSFVTLPEEAVSATATVAISSRRFVSVPPNSQSESAKKLVVGRLLRKVSPSYPMDAKAQRVEGTVHLHAIIDEDGRVRNLQATSGPQPLVEPSLAAVREWQYSPTLLEGRRVAVQDDVKLVFRLPD